MENKKSEEIKALLFGIAFIILLVVLFGKLVVYDCIIGNKLYDENDIVVRYHRYVNIVTVDNNSDNTIYMHYQMGRCKLDANNDKRKYDIKYYERSEEYEIEPDSKLTKYTSIFDDAYVFTISNEEYLYESVGFNKHEWF